MGEQRPEINDPYERDPDFSFTLEYGGEPYHLKRTNTVLYWDSKGMMMSHIFHVVDPEAEESAAICIYDLPMIWTTLDELGYQVFDMHEEPQVERLAAEVLQYCDYSEDFHTDFDTIEDVEPLLEEYAHYKYEQTFDD